jgi:hypothetical protein
VANVEDKNIETTYTLHIQQDRLTVCSHLIVTCCVMSVSELHDWGRDGVMETADIRRSEESLVRKLQIPRVQQAVRSCTDIGVRYCM